MFFRGFPSAMASLQYFNTISV
uniref:Uncharacterized protein n=1 Tax=Anguilla anguilla TaxID=7936 RepID=A0A0E9SEP0_ANGAN